MRTRVAIQSLTIFLIYRFAWKNGYQVGLERGFKIDIMEFLVKHQGQPAVVRQHPGGQNDIVHKD